jgi:amino acid transporter
MLALVGKGIFDLIAGTPTGMHAINLAPAVPSGLTLFVLLKAFSSGCSAVTGIEAISNTVPNFKNPSERNAKRTLVTLAVLLAVIFGGVTILSLAYGIAPDPTGHTSVLSMVTEQAFGRGGMYFITQMGTMLILVLAANTSFNGFPILSSIMANDKNFPRMFSHRGDRLAYNYGIVTLGVLSSLLLIAFRGKTDLLIPLYAIGVFLSFTLSQSGLVLKWLREKPKGWVFKLLVNGIGALITLAVVLIFSITKFMEGAWIVIVITPILLWVITKVYNHYELVANELRINLDDPLPEKESIIIIPIAGIHRVVASTIAYAKTLSPNVIAFYVTYTDEEEQKMEEKWEKWNPGVRLVVFKSRYRTLLKPLSEFIERIQTHVDGKQTVMVMLPQFVARKWWHRLLHNQSAKRIRSKLQAEKDIVVTIVPYHLHD